MNANKRKYMVFDWFPCSCVGTFCYAMQVIFINVSAVHALPRGSVGTSKKCAEPPWWKNWRNMILKPL